MNRFLQVSCAATALATWALWLCTTLPCRADAPPPHLWSLRAGDAWADHGRAVTVDGNRNVIVTGVFTGAVDFGGGALGSAGKADVFVAKYGPNGPHAWSRAFGGATGDAGMAVAADGSGNVIVTGAFSGTINAGGVDLVSAGDTDVFVVKYGADGAHAWSRRFGGEGTDIARSLGVDASGRVVVVGDFEGSAGFGDGMLVSAGANDAFVVTLDPGGDVAWRLRLGGVDYDWGIGVVVDDAGNVVTTGEFNGAVDFGGGLFQSAGHDDIFLAAYDAAGDHQWSRAFGGIGYDGGHALVLDDSGNVFLTGEMEATVDFGGGMRVSAGAQDIVVAKFGPAGEHRWSRCFGDGDTDRGHGIACDDSGNVVVSGFFAGVVDFGGGALSSAGGGADIFVAAFGAAGDHRWSWCLGGAGSDIGYGVAVDRAGNVVVTGGFAATVDFGGGDLVSAGDEDVFVAGFGAGIATGPGNGPRRAGPSILAYPNPFNPVVTIHVHLPAAGRVVVDILDLKGTRVATLFDASRAAGDLTLSWEGLAGAYGRAGSGVYWVRVRHPSGSKSQKIVLLR